MTSWHKDERLVTEGARCDNCKWAEPIGNMNTSCHAESLYCCHFNPPTGNGFPRVYPSDYCGQFVKKIRSKREK